MILNTPHISSENTELCIFIDFHHQHEYDQIISKLKNNEDIDFYDLYNDIGFGLVGLNSVSKRLPYDVFVHIRRFDWTASKYPVDNTIWWMDCACYAIVVISPNGDIIFDSRDIFYCAPKQAETVQRGSMAKCADLLVSAIENYKQNNRSDISAIDIDELVL